MRGWQSVVVGRSFELGMDDNGRCVRLLEGGKLVCADDSNMLFFLPMLDLEAEEFERQIGSHTAVKGEFKERVSEMVDAVLTLALAERSPHYAERALAWLKWVPLSDKTRAALREFSISKRGTQKQRQSARLLAKR